MAKVEYVKDFTNVDELFDKLLELGFFANEAHRDERKHELTDDSNFPHNVTEHWFSNGVAEKNEHGFFRMRLANDELRNFTTERVEGFSFDARSGINDVYPNKKLRIDFRKSRLFRQGVISLSWDFEGREEKEEWLKNRF